jgi:hypothetical protein
MVLSAMQHGFVKRKTVESLVMNPPSLFLHKIERKSEADFNLQKHTHLT